VSGRKQTAIIYITDKCNLSCPDCYYKKQLRKEDNNSQEAWRKRFLDYYRTGIRHVMLIGGEPAMRLDVLELASKIFPFVTVITNGTIKIPENIKCRINLSLDGRREIHDKIRGDGAYEKALANYSQDRRAVVYLTLGKSNYAGPNELREFINEIKREFSGLFVNYYFPQIGDAESYNHILSSEELLEIRRVLLGEKQKDRFILNTRRNIIDQTEADANKIKCRLPELISIYSSQNEKYSKIYPKTDCRHCRFIFRYDVPIWNLPEWIRVRLMRKKILFN
jgi:sulfatase maturation enzyme AslB (radical SAM superfamily)